MGVLSTHSVLLDLSFNFPVEQSVQVVEDQLLVCFNISVGLSNTQVDTRRVN